jgi:hypothetical protein
MTTGTFDEVYQALNEKFINEIIDNESEKLMGTKDITVNFLMLGENDKNGEQEFTQRIHQSKSGTTVFEVD